MNKLSREQAWSLLTEHNKSEALLRHALQVETVMTGFAKKYGEDEEIWGVTGLLHDLDYEMFPDEHCHKAKEIMTEKGVDETYIRAMMCHGWGICTDTEPLSNMEKTLFTIDELTGLIYAACLMRPSKSVLDVEVKSIKKKFKDKHFAAGVDRELILKGCDMLSLTLDEVIDLCILGLRERAEETGLKGNL